MPWAPRTAHGRCDTWITVTTTDAHRRTLCVLPGIPERRTGGGLLLFEVLAYLATRGQIAAVVPTVGHVRGEFEETTGDPLLAGVEWHALEPERLPGITGYLHRLVSPLPAEVAKFATASNRGTLDSLRRRFAPDVELVISSWALAPYANLALPSRSRLYMVNVDPDIVRYDGPSLKRRLASVVDRPKVRRLCRRALSMAGRIGAISTADVPELNRLGRRADVTYVPPLMRPRPVDRSKAVPNTVLITTNFTYSQNVTSLEWFFRECWPLVSHHAQLTVTGKDEHDRLATLCRANPRTTYAGCVSPADLDDTFARTAVAVNPTRLGSGFQIKLLDALARGVPIVSTMFSNKVGAAIPASDDPKMLAELIDSHLAPDEIQPFDYAAFYDGALAAWDRFLFSV